jgi:hypothetical protein
MHACNKNSSSSSTRLKTSLMVAPDRVVALNLCPRWRRGRLHRLTAPALGPSTAVSTLWC